MIAIKDFKTKTFKSEIGWEVYINFCVPENTVHFDDFLELTKEWVQPKGALYSSEDVEKYLLREDLGCSYQDLVTLRKPIASILMQQDMILSYDSATRSFIFNENITRTLTTEAIVQELKNLRVCKSDPSYTFSDDHYFLACIKALSLFWF